MNTQIQYPKVMLVGRTNVGKSTLFNRLAGNKKSIVFEREGVTRDYLHELVSWADKTFDLIDTGGLTFKKNHDPIWVRVQEKVLTLLAKAEILLFVCDGKNGLTEEDRQIAKVLHKTKKPVFLLLNKADSIGAFDEHMHEFYTLGFKTILPISGIHGLGTGTLLDAVTDLLGEPQETVEEKPSYKVAILGKPNVGKSSLMNLLINQERSIVSDIAGTTREAISETIYHCTDLIQLTDTAGVRKQAKVNDELEELMVKSSFSAVREADVILLMADASEGKISDQELKLLFYAYEQRKMIIVVFNKIDLLDEYSRQTLEQSMLEYNFILKKTPQIWMSCLTRKNVTKIFNEIQLVWQRSKQKFNSTQVDETVKGELIKKVLYHNGLALKLFKIRNVPAPIPTFVLHVNHADWFGPSQLGCIENILRAHYDLKGCPIQFSVKNI